MTFVAFDNITKEEFAERVAKECQQYDKDCTPEEIIEIMNNDPERFKDVCSSMMGTYDNFEFTGSIQFFEDGSYIINIPEGCPDGFLAMISIKHPITEEIIKLSKGYRKFVEIGDAQVTQAEPPKSDKSPSWKYSGIEKSTKSFQHLTGSASSKITSDVYDVETAIPTSEDLKFSVSGVDDTLFDITVRTYRAYAGVKDMRINTTIRYYYDCNCPKYGYREYTRKDGTTYKKYEQIGVLHPNQKHIGSVTRTNHEKYSYETSKTMYDVPLSNMFPVNSAIIGGAPTENSVSISLSGGPSVGAKILDVYANSPALNSQTLTMTYSAILDSRSAAENNDIHASLYANGKSKINLAVSSAIGYRGNIDYYYRGLNVTSTSNNNQMPSIEYTGGSTNKEIPSYKLNGTYSPSGVVLYGGGYTTSFKPNDVIVHTPVVNDTKIIPSEFVNQKINKDDSKVYLMLDEQFKIEIAGGKDYNPFAKLKGYLWPFNSYANKTISKKPTSWGRTKEIKLPFDAYLHSGENERILIKANEWFKIPGDKDPFTCVFTVPVWTKEGDYTIETRVIAENTQDESLTQELANTDIAKYVATSSTKVEVIGKIYDLRISVINDPGWENIKGKYGNYITAREFPFGQIGQNKMTTYKFAPKLGYTFVFDFKTKGTKSNNVDVSIQPEGFYFVGKNGGNAKKVDLYYHTTKDKYVKIDANNSTDNIKLIVNLGQKFMKVPYQELADSLRIMKQKYIYNKDIKIGTGFSNLKLPEDLRLCYNNFIEYSNKLYKKAEKDIIQDAQGSVLANEESLNGRDTVIRSVGHWYAGYKLPASTMALDPTKASITKAVSNPDLFEKEGYVLVKFGIKTNYNQYPYLKYTGPEILNESGKEVGRTDPEKDWTKDISQTIVLPNGKKATIPGKPTVVAIYEGDLKSSNDLEVSGTH